MASTDDIAAMYASFEGKLNSSKLAALLNLPKTTVEGRIYQTWKKRATALEHAAMAQGRLNKDGSVNEGALPAAKSTPRDSKKALTAKTKYTPGKKDYNDGDGVDDAVLHGTKTGRVTKPSRNGLGVWKGTASAGPGASAGKVEELEEGEVDETQDVAPW